MALVLALTASSSARGGRSEPTMPNCLIDTPSGISRASSSLVRRETNSSFLAPFTSSKLYSEPMATMTLRAVSRR